MRFPKAYVAVSLAIVAGSVDAIGFSQTGRFTSHITGTTTHTVARLDNGSMLLALLGALAIASFFAGACTTGVVLTAPNARCHATSVALLVAGEALTIAAGGLTMLALASSTWVNMLTVALLAFAMGMQNATTTYLLKPYERTTHVTSNTTDLGSEVGMRLRALAGLPSSRTLAAPDSGTMVSAFSCIAGFVLGGIAGIEVAIELGAWAGLCASILPVFIATAVIVTRNVT